MTAKVYDEAFDLLMKNEGGYVNNPNDKGGETKYGISKRAYPDLDIKNLTLEDAKKIYYRDYWCKCKCDNLPDAISVALFDFAVNSGVKRAVKKLQLCCGVLADGIMGNQTIGACNRMNTRLLLQDYINRRCDYLFGLADFVHFGVVWTKRVKRVQQFCEKYIKE